MGTGGEARESGSCGKTVFPEDKPFSCCVQVCELGEQLEQEKARCEDLLRQDRHSVNQYFHSLEVVLAKKRRACLDALDKAGAEACRAYDPLIHKVKELQVRVLIFKLYVCFLSRILAERWTT